jgi:hypothetical protein
MDGHKRYKDDAEHGDLVIKMFDYIERANILQAMMPWCVSSHPDIGLANPDFPDDGWYINRGGQRVARAVVGRMKEAKRQRGQ